MKLGFLLSLSLLTFLQKYTWGNVRNLNSKVKENTFITLLTFARDCRCCWCLETTFDFSRLKVSSIFKRFFKRQKIRNKWFLLEILMWFLLKSTYLLQTPWIWWIFKFQFCFTAIFQWPEFYVKNRHFTYTLEFWSLDHQISWSAIIMFLDSTLRTTDGQLHSLILK